MMAPSRPTSEYFLLGGRPEPGKELEARGRTTTVEITSPPGIFNGIQWTAQRLLVPSFPPGTTAEDKQKLVKSTDANVTRPPLKRGEIPPLSLKPMSQTLGLYVDERNSRARESLEILRDLKNAANRVPKPRHALEKYILKNFVNHPGWIGNKRVKQLDLSTDALTMHSERGVPNSSGPPEPLDQRLQFYRHCMQHPCGTQC